MEEAERIGMAFPIFGVADFKARVQMTARFWAERTELDTKGARNHHLSCNRKLMLN
jgi:hypothetical protein